MQRHPTLLTQHLARHGVELHLFHTCKNKLHIEDTKNLKGFPEDIKNKIHHYFIEYPEEGRLPGHYIRDLKEYSLLVYSEYKKQNLEVDFSYAKGLTGWAFVNVKKISGDKTLIGICSSLLIPAPGTSLTTVGKARVRPQRIPIRIQAPIAGSTSYRKTLDRVTDSGELTR